MLESQVLPDTPASSPDVCYLADHFLRDYQTLWNFAEQEKLTCKSVFVVFLLADLAGACVPLLATRQRKEMRASGTGALEHLDPIRSPARTVSWVTKLLLARAGRVQCRIGCVNVNYRSSQNFENVFSS